MIFGEYSYEDDIRVQRQEAFEEGAAKQKEEDEKQLAKKDAENARLNERIAELESLLAKK